MPPSGSSPALRALTNITSSCCFDEAGNAACRVSVMFTVPSATVVPAAPANWLYGVTCTSTCAPSTGRPLQAVMRKCAMIWFVEPEISAGAVVCWSTWSRAGGERSVTLTAPVPLGQPVAAVVPTTAVGTDVPESLPSVFVAVTTERSVEPPSAFLSTYVLAVAPLIAAQLAPFSSQRCHTYVNVGA